MRPVVAPGTLDATGTRITDLGIAAHLAVDHDQRAVQQAAVVKVFQQGRKILIELGQQAASPECP